MARDLFIWRWGRAYLGVIFFPYQLAVGLTLRRLDGWHVRVYAGPLKLWSGVGRG